MKIEIKERQWDLLIIITLAAVLIGFSLTVQTSYLRNTLGLIFVLFLPGYTITSALFPKDEDMGKIERIALSLGLSIAVVSLIGFLLNYTPWGINLLSILVSMFILIICFSAMAWYRRIQIPIEDRFCITISFKIPKKEEFYTADYILTVLIVISIIIAILAVIYTISVPPVNDGYTEFYVFDENKSTENYPKNLSVGENGTLIIGLVSHEHKTTQYIIKIQLVNLTGARDNKTLGEYNIILDHTQRNEILFNFSVSNDGNYQLQILLYIEEVAEPYRELHLWIDIRP